MCEIEYLPFSPRDRLLIKKKIMNSKLFNFNFIDLQRALSLGLCLAIVIVISYIIKAGTIWGLNWMDILSSGIIGFLGVLGSFLRTLLTTQDGNFIGLVQVMPQK